MCQGSALLNKASSGGGEDFNVHFKLKEIYTCIYTLREDAPSHVRLGMLLSVLSLRSCILCSK